MKACFVFRMRVPMMVVEAADLKAGERVLDVCAAPGGKSLHAAAKLYALGDGIVEARDVT